MLTGHTRGDTEAGQPGAAALDVYEHVRGLDVFMDQTSVVYPAERTHERDRNAQEFRDDQRFSEQSVEEFAAGIFENQRDATISNDECRRPRSPVSLERVPERMFMFKPLEALARRIFPDLNNQQDGIEAGAGPAIEAQVLPQRRKRVTGKLQHKSLPTAFSVLPALRTIMMSITICATPLKERTDYRGVRGKRGFTATVKVSRLFSAMPPTITASPARSAMRRAA